MAQSPYYDLIQRYFPPEEYEHADCISVAECPPSSLGYPAGCTERVGVLRCGETLPYVNASKFGLFGILDACWDPEVNPDSPFTAELWARRMEPAINTWMASIIWSRSGWRAWTSCATCGLCQMPGGPVPYPRGPNEGPMVEIAGPGPVLLAAGGVVLAIGAVAYVAKGIRRR